MKISTDVHALDKYIGVDDQDIYSSNSFHQLYAQMSPSLSFHFTESVFVLAIATVHHSFALLFEAVASSAMGHWGTCPPSLPIISF